jgi:hypothetical protein
MGKSSPKAPAAPDPVVTAKAQTESNIATANNNAALNRVNQFTPWGSSTYTKNAGADGDYDSWTQNVDLAPEQKALLDAQNRSSLALSQTGENMLGTVNGAMSKQMDYSGLTKINNGLLQSSASQSLPQMAGAFDNPGIQSGVDMSGVSALVGGDKLYDAMRQAQDASYNQAQSRLDPQWSQQQHDLENKLVQQGIMQNSDAWNRATESFGRNRNDAYQTARNYSVGEGNTAQAQLFGQGLAVNQNAYGQASNNMAMRNAAQAQGFGQSMQNAVLQNAVNAQQFGQNLSNAQLANQAAGQGFSQSMAERQQGINELMAQRQNPLNELNALRTGSQVTNPTFGATPQVNQAGVDVAGITNNAYNNQLGLYNAQVGSNNSTMGMLGQLGGAAMMATKF